MGIKYEVNEKFFKKWSSIMAYLLGYIYADGHLIDTPQMRGKYLNITSIDKDSILRIRNWLSSKHRILIKKSHFSGSKDCFVLRIGSHKIYNDLFGLGLYPNKSLTINLPKIPQKYFWHFIRGYFDGDGCVYLEKKLNKIGKPIIKRIRIIFTSGSLVFLEEMNREINEFIKLNGKIYKSKRSYQLVYNSKDSVLIFKKIYEGTSKNSFFMRKFKIFEEYFKLRPSNIDSEINKIIKVHIGHVVK
jgi:hypothetical protein